MFANGLIATKHTTGRSPAKKYDQNAVDCINTGYARPMQKKILHSLLFWVVVAIALGFACSFFFPDWLARVFVTFNGLFSNFLGFFVPVLIFALIAPAIAGLGQGAGKWLGVTAGVAYGSTFISGLIAWFTASTLYPRLPVSYTHLTLPTTLHECRSRWSPYH